MKKLIILSMISFLFSNFNILEGMQRQEEQVIIREKPRKPKTRKPTKIFKYTGGKKKPIPEAKLADMRIISNGLDKYIKMLGIEGAREVSEVVLEKLENGVSVEDIQNFLKEMFLFVKGINDDSKRDLNTKLLELECERKKNNWLADKLEKINEEENKVEVLVKARIKALVSEMFKKDGVAKALDKWHNGVKNSIRMNQEIKEKKRESSKNFLTYITINKGLLALKEPLNKLYTSIDDTKNQENMLEDGSEIVDIAVLLGAKEIEFNEIEYKIDPVVNRCVSLIDDGVRVIVVSAPLLFHLSQLYTQEYAWLNTISPSSPKRRGLEETRDQIRDFKSSLRPKLTNRLLNIYVTREHENEDYKKEPFAVIISKTNDSEEVDLKSLGLNDAYLKPIAFENISDELSEVTENENQIDCFKKIFYNPTDEQEKNNLPRKIIYAIGHGAYAENLEKDKENVVLAGTYMGLESHDYETLLDYLEKIKCVFLSIHSCFSGAYNALRMHQNRINFPIVVTSLADNVVNPPGRERFQLYFDNIKDLINRNVSFTLWAQNEKFKAALRSVCSSSLRNMPSIIFPSADAFKLLNINNIKVIELKSSTYNAPIVADNQDGLLFYKEILKTPIRITGRIPTFVSKIPATAHHFLEKVEVSDNLIRNLIIGMLGDLENISPKMFFIGDLSSLSCSEFLNINPSLKLHIKNFFALQTTEGEDDNRNEIFYITGSGILRFEGRRFYLFKQDDMRFEYDYNTRDRRLNIRVINKEQYLNNLLDAMKKTIPRKEVMSSLNPGNLDYIQRTDWDNEVYYNVDVKFLPELNNSLKTEEALKLHFMKNEYIKEIITREPGLLEQGFLRKFVCAIYNLKDTTFTYPPLKWLPNRLKYWFVNPPVQEESSNQTEKIKRN